MEDDESLSEPTQATATTEAPKATPVLPPFKSPLTELPIGKQEGDPLTGQLADLHSEMIEAQKLEAAAFAQLEGARKRRSVCPSASS